MRRLAPVLALALALALVFIFTLRLVVVLPLSNPVLVSSNRCSAFQIELPSEVKLILDGELEDSEIKGVCAGVIDTKKLFNSYGVDLPSANIYLFADRQRAINKLASLTSRGVWTNNTTGLTVGRNIMININSTSWTIFRDLTTHELTHVLQKPANAAKWFIEGSAEYMRVLVKEMRGGESRDTIRSYFPETIYKYSGGDIDLRLLESHSSFRNAKLNYPIAYIAFDLLNSEREEGVKDYLTCYVPEHRSTSWRKAFEKCFDMSVNEFYDLFEEYKSLGFSEFPIERRERERVERELELA